MDAARKVASFFFLIFAPFEKQKVQYEITCRMGKAERHPAHLAA